LKTSRWFLKECQVAVDLIKIKLIKINQFQIFEELMLKDGKR
jgi:hypothetical protein